MRPLKFAKYVWVSACLEVRQLGGGGECAVGLHLEPASWRVDAVECCVVVIARPRGSAGIAGARCPWPTVATSWSAARSVWRGADAAIRTEIALLVRCCWGYGPQGPWQTEVSAAGAREACCSPGGSRKECHLVALRHVQLLPRWAVAPNQLVSMTGLI